MKKRGKSGTPEARVGAKPDRAVGRAGIIASSVLTALLIILSLAYRLGLLGAGGLAALIYSGAALVLYIPTAIILWRTVKTGLLSVIRIKFGLGSVGAIGAVLGTALSLVLMAMALLKDPSYADSILLDAIAASMLLIALGGYLDEKTAPDDSGVKRLRELMPPYAMTVTLDGERLVPVSELERGSVVVVSSGEVIPCDGEIISGRLGVDRSIITGEGQLVGCETGQRVYLGTRAASGYARIRVEAVGEESSLGALIKSAEEKGSGKARPDSAYLRADMLIALGITVIAVAAFIFWLFRGETVLTPWEVLTQVLVLSSPYAFLLARSSAYIYAKRKCHREGILLKDPRSCDKMARVDTVVVDKTGTVTVGRPFVTRVVPFGVSAEELVMLAASLAEASAHPISQAILDYAQKNDIYPDRCEDCRIEGGTKLLGTVGESRIAASSPEEMYLGQGQNEGYMAVIKPYMEDGRQIISLSKDDVPIGILILADRLKPTSRTALRSLRSMGIKTVMLTGDREQAARGLLGESELSELISEVSPEQKGGVVAGLCKSGTVAMVGDSVNDIAALASSDVGIAMGAGSVAVVDSAQMVLLRNDLRDIAKAIRLSRTLSQIIKGNFFWSVFYSAIMLPVTAGLAVALGKEPVPSAAGIISMGLSFISVFLNSSRILAHDLTKKEEPAEKITESKSKKE